MSSTLKSDDLPGKSQPIAWDRGWAEIWPLGATIHHLTLRLDDCQEIAPLAEASWHGDPETTGDAKVAPHLRWLGGEWPCVPFGRTGVDPVVHGFGTDNPWRVEKATPHSCEWRIDYPENHPIERLTRTVAGIPGKAAIVFTLSVMPRRDCELPVGLHPIVKLPEVGEALRVEGRFSHGETFPVVFEKDVSRLAPSKRFANLDALPLAAGGTLSLSDLCRQTTEEAFQLLGVDGHLTLTYPHQRYALQLNWNAADFPTCLFWLSAGGRRQKPWNGRFRGMGVEPLHARFEERDGAGAITGGRAFRAGEIWTTSYTLSVEASAGQGEEGR